MKQRKGFSLIEIMICLGVMIALARLILPNATGYSTIGHDAAVKADLAKIAAAVAQHKYEIGDYPAALSQLTEANGSHGPWLPSGVLTDKYGSAVNYAVSQEKKKFAVWSSGRDKASNASGGSDGVPETFGGDDAGIFMN
jgi:general secretion pathway protein G